MEEEIYQSFIDGEILDLVYDIHKQVKKKELPLEDIYDKAVTTGYLQELQKAEFSIINNTVDIFGKRPMVSTDTLICEHCKRSVSAVRFAPHLDKCMAGGGRKKSVPSKIDYTYTEEEDEEPERKRKKQVHKEFSKRKKDRDSPIPVKPRSIPFSLVIDTHISNNALTS